MIYLRRSDDQGNVPLLAQTFPVAEHWVHRLVRCEVDFTHRASASTPCAAATPITSRCFARYLTFVPTNHFRASHERSINAETLSRRCQTSVQLTLKLAPLYKTVCDIASQRLYVFGRKNRKMFDKEHRDFLNCLTARVASGFDFRCLFLDPASEPHVLSSAHEDPDFPEQLWTSIKQAYKGVLAAGLNPADHCRMYHIVRTTTAIMVDDAVLFTHIRMNQEGRAKRLTKCGFTIVNADSALSAEILQEFLALWNTTTSTPLPQL